MKNIIKFAIAILTLSLLISCTSSTGGENSGGSGKGDGTSFVLKAIVQSINEKIEVEVIESDYAFGPYWVITSEQTDFEGRDGMKISRDEINVGDTVEITYSGQVMMSYPPQIVAHKIVVK